MNNQQIAENLRRAALGRTYGGKLSSYSVKSIEHGRSNYPVSNLITYCKDLGIRMIFNDMATEDLFYPETILDVHKVINLLMNRYNVDNKLVYRKTAVHYTSPKSFGENDCKDAKQPTPLSIGTLCAVCKVIHCNLLFEPK